MKVKIVMVTIDRMSVTIDSMLETESIGYRNIVL